MHDRENSASKNEGNTVVPTYNRNGMKELFAKVPSNSIANSSQTNNKGIKCKSDPLKEVTEKGLGYKVLVKQIYNRSNFKNC